MKTITKSTPRQEKEEPLSESDAIRAVRTLIRWVGEDPDREGLVDTPKRVIKAYKELFSGYLDNQELDSLRYFEEMKGFSGLLVVRDVPFFSHCEHHMVPFYGHVHIGYYPKTKIVGLSKFGRIVEHFARRLQTQETLTIDIMSYLQKALDPLGLAIVLEAEHLCMSMRGISKPGIKTTTQQFYGCFAEQVHLQHSFILTLKQ